MHSNRTAFPRILVAVAFCTVLASALAQGARVVADAGLSEVFAILARGYDGPTPELVEAGGQLELRHGDAHWRDNGTVTVLPGILLSETSEDADARDFLRYASSAAAQRLLVDAGLLPPVVQVTDQAGRTFDVTQPVERLASPYSLAPYLAYALGAGDRVVMAGFLGARDPAGAAAMTRIDVRFPELASVTPQQTTSVEFIATLAPDVVFAAARSDWIGPVETIGIPVIAFDGESLDGLRGAMRLAGSVLGPDAAARAVAWIEYYDHVLGHVADAIAASRRPTVLFTGTQRTTVASGAMYQSALIAAAGGLSATADLPGHWNEVGLERILLWNPDVVLVPPYGGASVEAIVNDPDWALLDAVRAGRVLRMPKLVAPWDTPVPDSVLAVVWLAEALHPGVVELSCAAETDFFYRRFYGYDISSEEVATLCER